MTAQDFYSRSFNQIKRKERIPERLADVIDRSPAFYAEGQRFNPDISDAKDQMVTLVKDLHLRPWRAAAKQSRKD